MKIFKKDSRAAAVWSPAFRRSAPAKAGTPNNSTRGSVLIIVLWIAFGLVAIALFFADSMSSEMRASDNRTSGLISDQAIDGAARYVSHILANFATNGVVPDISEYTAEAVPIGDAHFWLIGRDDLENSATTDEPYFALVDESSKLNLNFADSNMLSYLPNITPDFANAIIGWRDTNGGNSLEYAQAGYTPKFSTFETVGELRLVYGATMDMLAGGDLNHNGVLDANEALQTQTSSLGRGILDFATVYSREPNTLSDGTAKINITVTQELTAFLRTNFSNGNDMIRQLGLNTGGGGGGGTNQPAQPPPYNSVLEFYVRWKAVGLSRDDFDQIGPDITATDEPFIEGRVNVNTASVDVLACLPGMDPSLAQQLVSYRRQNAGNLESVAWVADALTGSTDALQTLARSDYITTQSYQFTADIAAVGPYGRGYRRVKFIFDTSEGAPKIIYRQDLGRLGWALGKEARQTWLAKNTQQP